MLLKINSLKTVLDFNLNSFVKQKGIQFKGNFNLGNKMHFLLFNSLR